MDHVKERLRQLVRDGHSEFDAVLGVLSRAETESRPAVQDQLFRVARRMLYHCVRGHHAKEAGWREILSALDKEIGIVVPPKYQRKGGAWKSASERRKRL